MKTYLLAGLLMAFCIGCRCEGTSSIKILIDNQSGYDLVILSYKDGITTINTTTLKSTSITMPNKSEKLLINTGGRGRENGWIGPFSFVDSLVVVFHSNKKVVHYFNNITGKNPNALLANSPRSLFNENSYARKTIIDDKCYLETELIYTFTEQDYLSAR